MLNTQTVLEPDWAAMGEAAKLFTRSVLMGLDSAVRRKEFAEPSAEDIENMPFTEAVEFLKKRDVITKIDYNKLSDRMRFRAFTVSRINDGKLLERIKNEMAANVRDGNGLKDFLSLTKTDVLDKIGMGPNQGWYWEVVYRTNVQTAYGAGRAMGFEEDKPLALEFIGIDDSRQTEICHSLMGIVRPYDDPFWKNHWTPMHFGCRSTIRAIYDKDELPEEWSSLDGVEKPAKGFGSYPLHKDDWWDELESQVRQAKQFGVQGEIEAAKVALGVTDIEKASKAENIKTAIEKIEQINKADKELRQDVKNIFLKQPYFKDMDPKILEMRLNTLDRLNTDQLKLLKNYSGRIPIVTEFDKRVSSSVYNGGEIRLKSFGDLFHEFGHFLDDAILGDKRARDYLTDFLDVLREDALKWINDNAEGVVVNSLEKIPKATRDLLNEKMRVRFIGDRLFERYADAGDILDGLTNGKLGGEKNIGTGHGKGYYKYNDVLKHIEGEAIAEITCAWYRPGHQISEGLREVFPNAYDMYVDFLRRQASVL